MPLWSVPANLLLAGEYAITRPGGVGVALAVAPRATVRVFPGQTRESALSFRRAIHTAGIRADGIRVDGFGPRKDRNRATPTPGSVPGLTVYTLMGRDRAYLEGGLLTTVLAEVACFIRDAGELPYGSRPVPLPPTEITIDTSAFFDPATGKKRGLGSSAAATVLLIAALLYLAGVDPLHNRNTLLGVAVRAHRRLQGGRGSGYDIACSTLGGAIRFVGGEIPRWERLNLIERWEEQGVGLYLWNGDTPVSSARSVEAFDRIFPPGDKATAFLRASNAAVGSLARADTWDEQRDALRRCAILSRKTGRSIGVPADLPRELRSDDLSWSAKATGAGNEQALIIGIDQDISGREDVRDAAAAGRIHRLSPERSGLREESP